MSAENFMPEVKYRVATPEVPLNARVVWQIGDDDLSTSILARLGKPTFTEDLEQALLVVNRSQFLDKIIFAAGRGATLKSETSSRVLGSQYDALEISGFGNLPFLSYVGNTGYVDFTVEIQVPSSHNFAQVMPNIVGTTVVGDSGFVTLEDPFSFTGAYTEAQAGRKIATNLVVLNHLAKQKKEAFLVPVPLAIIEYPTIVSPDGKPAYAVVFKVPYGGRRTSIMYGLSDQEVVDKYNFILPSLSRVSAALRILHDTTGLTHNQPGLGNNYMPKDQHSPIYLADWSTPFPISANPSLSCGHELKVQVDDVITQLNTIGFTQEAQVYVIQGLVPLLLEGYTGRDIVGQVRNTPDIIRRFPMFAQISGDLDQILVVFSGYLQLAVTLGLIPDHTQEKKLTKILRVYKKKLCKDICILKRRERRIKE
jgi:hypothetical protein